MRFSPLAPLWLATSTGCFSGLVDLDGLSDRGTSVVADASTAESGWSDAPATDAVSDVTDAGPTDVDVAPDADAGWCSTHGTALFCDDFEGAQAWDQYIIGPNAELALSPAYATSGSQSLRFHADTISQVGAGEGFRIKTTPALTESFTFSFQMRLQELSPMGASIPGQLILHDSAGVESRLSLLVEIPYKVGLEIARTQPGLPTEYSYYPLSPLPARQTWVRVDYVVTTAPRKLSVYLDGVPSLQGISATEVACSGILHDDVCCASSCGACTGQACDTRPGGAPACCGSEIRAAGISCADGPPPCVVTDYEVVPEIRMGGCYLEAPSGPWTVYYDDVLIQ